MLINNASGNRIISFLDGNAGYNQIFIVKEDASKITLYVQASLVYLSGLSLRSVKKCRCHLSEGNEFDLSRVVGNHYGSLH
jgi:hypothetical protein